MPKVIPTHMLTIGMDYDLTADAIKWMRIEFYVAVEWYNSKAIPKQFEKEHTVLEKGLTMMTAYV